MTNTYEVGMDGPLTDLRLTPAGSSREVRSPVTDVPSTRRAVAATPFTGIAGPTTRWFAQPTG